ncbi:protein arginine kinase [Fervidibacillus halotolerans]|uniref:Protein-arginine kinase n=1 Tax=Fervidibacillus halotolerans TaxID=2980027 RepID=A0A9E8M3F1_9BACI|nr:protein arginine kinase [Fervidibacillus halotolerans]WAA13856.1 protein arginine kinase [Fervidibacillus halotolerans]
MSFYRFIEQAASGWMKGEGPDSDVVISSRIRVARNLHEYVFPIQANHEQSNMALREILQASRQLDFHNFGEFEWFTLRELNDLEKHLLVEKHLISPQLANSSRNGAVILSDDESISIMVNEEDHLRIQCMLPGLQLQKAWDLAGQIDDVFESQLDYAYDEKIGYLTSCSTNVGTGLRASVMVHLPALVITEQINSIFFAMNQIGLVVRGMYGEGSDAYGNIFQISNQITLGKSEEEMIHTLYGVVNQIIEHERTARRRLLTESGRSLTNLISRSFGILSFATMIDSKEAAQRLSDVRLGIDLDIIRGVSIDTMNELMVRTQPAFIQQFAGQDLNAEDRDVYRAKIIRESLAPRDF